MVNYRKIVRRMSRDCLINTVLGWQPYKHCQRCEIEQRKTRDCAKRLYILGGRRMGMSVLSNIEFRELVIQGTTACMVVMDETFPEFVEPKVSIKHVPLEQWRRKGRKKKQFN